jgi:hypothetical protein
MASRIGSRWGIRKGSLYHKITARLPFNDDIEIILI